jgi:2-dehydropantoate 2-reductase
MRIVMMGSGGVGGYFGARLVKAGFDVGFVARGAHLAAMRKDGLKIESAAHGDFRIEKVNASDDPAALRPADYVIVSVKLWDTEQAAEAIRPLVGPRTAVLSLQNGVDRDDILRRALGEAAVMGGVAYVATVIESPGTIRQTGPMQRIVFGEYDGRESERARILHDALQRSGVTAELSNDVRRAIWEKYAFLVAMSGATASMRAPIGAIRANPRSRAFLQELMRETVAVGRAHGVALPDDFADARMKAADALPAEMKASMCHDLERGNRLELDWLSGGVAKMGEQLGVPTPANHAVRDILALHADGRGASAAA